MLQGDRGDSLTAMNVSDTALLLGAGLAAGTVNAIAGGGSLVTFPALLAVGLAPKPANFTNSVAVCPGYLASVYGSRHDLPAGRERRVLLPAAAVGSLAGCLLWRATAPGRRASPGAVRAAPHGRAAHDGGARGDLRRVLRGGAGRHARGRARPGARRDARPHQRAQEPHLRGDRPGDRRGVRAHR